MTLSVVDLYYAVLGALIALVGLIVGRIHPRTWRTLSNFLYVAGIALLLYVIFAGDPIDGIPSEIWNILEYLAIVGSFYGFLYKIERDLRTDFNDRANEIKSDLVKSIDGLKQDIHRDMDKLENRIDAKKTS